MIMPVRSSATSDSPAGAGPTGTAASQDAAQPVTRPPLDHLGGAFARQFGRIVLSRPLLLDADVAHAFSADLVTLHRVIASLTGRVFGDDVRAHMRAVGIGGALADVMDDHDVAGTDHPAFGRVDAYATPTGLKVLELNVGSEMGGIDAAVLNRAFLADPALGAWADEQGLRHVDTTERLLRRLQQAGRTVSGGADPRLVLVESPGNLADYGDVFTSMAEAFAVHGVTLDLAEIQQLEVRDDHVLLGGTPVHAILRFFTAGELLERDGVEALRDLQRAQRAGTVALVSPLVDGLLASKANLALLHDPTVRAALTADELGTIDRIVPWTRLLRPLGGTELDASTLRVVEADRERFMIKPGVGYSGVGAVMGRECDADTWRKALRDAAPDAVVQEVVVPLTEAVVDPDTGRTERWVANWGIFFDAEGYGGAFVRALRPDDGSIISFGNPGTRYACVFTREGSTR